MTTTKAIILAAGQSSRMGYTKALLNWNNKTTFIEQIINEYKKAEVTDITIVANSQNSAEIKSLLKKQYPNISIITNKLIKSERITSIKLGLENLENDSNAFIQDVDRPFISSELINNMRSAIKPSSYVSPCFRGKSGHPVLISMNIASDILASEKKTTLRKILGNYSEIKVDSQTNEIHLNINNIEEYQKYFK